MTSQKKWFSFLFCLGIACFPYSCLKAQQDTMQQFYQQCFDDFLFHPKGCELVLVKHKVASCWGGTQTVEYPGWLQAEDSLVYFVGKKFYLSANDYLALTPIELDTLADKYVLNKKEEATFDRMDQIAIGAYNYHPLIIAAWCFAKEKQELAQKIINHWQEQHPDLPFESAIKKWRTSLNWTHFAGLVHHYAIRKDRLAFRHGMQLNELLPDGLDADPQSKAVFEQVKNKLKVKPMTAKRAEEPPKDFDTWELSPKIDFLISALDEVDQRQSGQPGGVPLHEDWRVHELIKLGDTVVPRLIAVIETDKRLTRSVHFWRDFSPSRTVMNVKEAALSAIMSIWQDPIFRPVSTGDNFTSRGEEQAQILAKQLREQLATYGNKTLDERNLEIMLDTSKSFRERRKAIDVLARFGIDRGIGTTVWTDRLKENAFDVNPLIQKYTDPPLYQMIYEVMQAELADYDQEKGYTDFVVDELQEDTRTINGRYYIENSYFYDLTRLGDTDVLALYKAIYQTSKSTRLQRQAAYHSYWLGDSTLWEDYCLRLQKGEIKIPRLKQKKGDYYNNKPKHQLRFVALEDILLALHRIGNKISLETTAKITSPKHPYYPIVEDRLLWACKGYEGSSGFDFKDAWENPAFCFRIYSSFLQKKKYADVDVYLGESGGTFDRRISLRLHPMWYRSDFEESKQKARICDLAAIKLYQLIWGIPISHPHLKDKDERIARQQAFLKRFKKLRRISTYEYNHINDLSLGARYIPDLKPLERPATPQDVEEGKAIFSLSNSRIKEMSLPAWGIVKAHQAYKKPMKAIIVQAEVAADGTLYYGAFTEDGPKKYRAEELIEIQPIPQED